MKPKVQTSLISNKDTIKFLKWYLSNPIHIEPTSWCGDYEPYGRFSNEDLAEAKKVLAQAEQNGLPSFRNNIDTLCLSDWDSFINDKNDSQNDLFHDCGLSSKEYLNSLKTEKLVSASDVIKYITKVNNHTLAKAKPMAKFLHKVLKLWAIQNKKVTHSKLKKYKKQLETVNNKIFMRRTNKQSKIKKLNNHIDLVKENYRDNKNTITNNYHGEPDLDMMINNTQIFLDNCAYKHNKLYINQDNKKIVIDKPDYYEIAEVIYNDLYYLSYINLNKVTISGKEFLASDLNNDLFNQYYIGNKNSQSGTLVVSDQSQVLDYKKFILHE